MTVTGSDASYKSGGPQVPLQEDTMKTAAETVPQRALLIAKDSINDPTAMAMMLNTDEMKRSGHYQSKASQPPLDMPLGQLRLGDVSQKPSDEEELSKREQLINAMPQDARERLAEEEQLPFEQRSFLYTGLSNLLTYVARGLVGLEKAGQPLTEDSIYLQRYQDFALLPYVGLLGATRSSNDVSSFLQGNLEGLGHNYPDFDALMQESGYFSETMQSFSDVSGRALSGEATPDDAAKMQDLAGQLGQRIETLQGRDIGGSSGVFLPQMQAAHLVAQSFSDPTHAAPSALLGQSIAQIGLANPQEGSSGVLGNGLNAGLEGLLGNLGGSENVVRTFVTSLLLGVAVTTALISAAGLGATPQKGEKEVEASRSFDTQIAMHFVLSSGLFDTMINGIADAAQVPENERDNFHAALSLGVIATAVLTSGNANEDRQAALAASLESFIQPHLQTVMNENTTKEAEANEEADKEDATKSIALQQSIQAFENGHFLEMTAILKAMLGNMSGDPEVLQKDFESFSSTVGSFGDSVQGGINAQNTQLPPVALAG